MISLEMSNSARRPMKSRQSERLAGLATLAAVPMRDALASDEYRTWTRVAHSCSLAYSSGAADSRDAVAADMDTGVGATVVDTVVTAEDIAQDLDIDAEGVEDSKAAMAVASAAGDDLVALLVVAQRSLEMAADSSGAASPAIVLVRVLAFVVQPYRPDFCNQHIDKSWSNSHHPQSIHNTVPNHKCVRPYVCHQRKRLPFSNKPISDTCIPSDAPPCRPCLSCTSPRTLPDYVT